MDTKVTKGKPLVFIRSYLRRRVLFKRLQGHKVFYAFSDLGLILLSFYPFILYTLRKSCSNYFEYFMPFVFKTFLVSACPSQGIAVRLIFCSGVIISFPKSLIRASSDQHFPHGADQD